MDAMKAYVTMWHGGWVKYLGTRILIILVSNSEQSVPRTNSRNQIKEKWVVHSILSHFYSTLLCVCTNKVTVFYTIIQAILRI